MSTPLFTVDAFADGPFTGNPAAVCLLAEPREDAWMQDVAREMNLSETAFLRRRPDGFTLRWFTPVVEVDLCGHATLASAHVLWESGELPAGETARFHSRSGPLAAVRRDGRIEMDFPSKPESPAPVPEGLLEALGAAAVHVGRNVFDYLVEVESEDVVRRLRPDSSRIARLPVRGVIVTARAAAPGAGYDFVSRFFAPAAGVAEDPVTGSAHCALAPYWAAKLGRDRLVGRQLSARGGTVHVRVAGDRVMLGGNAVTVMRGELV
jgi:PhzF family phenazine biosynthesis protein